MRDKERNKKDRGKETRIELNTLLVCGEKEEQLFIDVRTSDRTWG